MKSYLKRALVLVLFVVPLRAREPIDLTDLREKTSYALGLDIISMFQRQGIEVDRHALAAGIADVLSGKPRLTPEEKKAAIVDLFTGLAAKAEEERKIQAVENLRAGRAFLAANAGRAGVNIIRGEVPDGSSQEMQYIVLQSGAGPSPQATDIVEVHYEGSGIDGIQFDSSVKRATPATFGMSEVMPGWKAVLSRMKAGDKWRLFIPGPLGFGESGGAARFSPNALLIYDLELLSFYSPGAGEAPKAPVTTSK